MTESINERVSLGNAATGTYVHNVSVGKTGSGNFNVSDVVSVELATLSGLHLGYGIVREVSGLEYSVALAVYFNVSSHNLGEVLAFDIPNHYILGVLITKLVGDTNGHSTAELRCGSAVNGHSEIVDGIIADSVKNLGIKIELALVLSFSAELNLTGKSVLDTGVGNEGCVLKLNVIRILYGLGVNLSLGGFLSGNGGLGYTASTGVKSGNAVCLKYALTPSVSIGIGIRNVIINNLVTYRAGMNLNTGNGAGRGSLDAYCDLMLGILFTASLNSLTASRAGRGTNYLIGTSLTVNRNLGLGPYCKRIRSVSGSVICSGIIGDLGLLTACVRAGVLNVTVLGTGSGLKLFDAIVVTGSGSYVIASRALVGCLAGRSCVVAESRNSLNAFLVAAGAGGNDFSGSSTAGLNALFRPIVTGSRNLSILV